MRMIGHYFSWVAKRRTEIAMLKEISLVAFALFFFHAGEAIAEDSSGFEPLALAKIPETGMPMAPSPFSSVCFSSNSLGLAVGAPETAANCYDAKLRNELLLDVEEQKFYLSFLLLERLHNIDSIDVVGAGWVSGIGSLVGIASQLTTKTNPIGLFAGAGLTALNEFADSVKNENAKREYVQSKNLLGERYASTQAFLSQDNLVEQFGVIDTSKWCTVEDLASDPFVHKDNPEFQDLTKEYLAIIESAFSEYGIYPDRPFLNRPIVPEQTETLILPIAMTQPYGIWTCSDVYDFISLNQGVFTRYRSLLGTPKYPDLFFYRP